MLKKRWIFLVQILAVCLYVVAPLQTGADSVGSGVNGASSGLATSVAAFAPLLITEMQAGSGTSASEEFIELYNQSAQPIVLASSQWQLQITSSKATSWTSPYRTVALSGTIAAGGYYLLASSYQATGAASSYLSTVADASFSAGLSADSGHVRLVYNATAGVAATQATDDELEWTTSSSGQPTSASIDARTPFTLNTSLVGGTSLKRLITATGIFADTNNDAADFIVSPCPSPTGARASAALAAAQSQPASGSAATQTLADGAPLPTTIDATNQACVSAPVATDTNTSTSSSTDGLTAPVADPPSSVVPSVETISSSETTAPVTVPLVPQSDIGLAAPQLTEVLPNPAAPLTDANDEFIELYNSNTQAFDLSGFSLETGGKTKHHYTFPQGTALPAHGFVAFFSSTTGIGLSNSGGAVSLLDPPGKTIGQTDIYATAKDGQAWALAKGVWQWTTTPTPNAANVITTPSTKASAAKVATKKTTAKTTVASKKPAKSATAAITNGSNFTDASTTSTPIHSSVLALTAVFALLYGAYEYRTDVANRIYQLRKYRAHRRERRASLAGRRGG